MPLLDAEEIVAIVDADPGGAPAVLPRVDGRLQPLCALYSAAPLPAPALTAVVEALAPQVLERERGEAYLNVNIPADLGRADAALRARSAA
jgi:molybdopterin-guanine dinucleotide biosynthesis protein A